MPEFTHYGQEKISFEMPAGWRVSARMESGPEAEPYPKVAELTALALDDPQGEGLADLIKPGMKVAVITDDGARPTPVKEMLPALFDRLEALGVKREDIDIVVGLGTHAVMDQAALDAKFGAHVLTNYRLTQHDCHAKDLTPVTKLDTGCQVGINPLVAAADIRIGVGSIFPHPMNGFGGGPKIVFPAVANYDAIREHHLALTPISDSVYGNTTTNRFYSEVTRIAKEAGLTFSLNCVFDLADEVAKVLFGPFEKVHEKGGELSREICGMDLARPGDVALISAFPYTEPFQIMKPMIIASLACKPGGTVIEVAKTKGPFPEDFVALMERFEKEAGGDLKKFAVESFRSGKLLLEGAPVDFNCALFFALVCKSDFRVVLVSDTLDAEASARMGFVHYKTLREALKAESARTPEAKVNLLPLGGTLPVLPGGLSMPY